MVDRAGFVSGGGRDSEGDDQFEDDQEFPDEQQPQFPVGRRSGSIGAVGPGDEPTQGQINEFEPTGRAAPGELSTTGGFGEPEVQQQMDRDMGAQDRDLREAQRRERRTPDDDPRAVDRAALDGADGAMPERRRVARNVAERRARSTLAGRSEFIDPEDVEFVERNGGVVATVGAETARLLGGIGFDPDAALAPIRPGPSRSGGEDAGVPGGGLDVDLGAVEDAAVGLTPGERQATKPQGADLTGPRGEVELALEEQVGGGVDFGPTDIEFTEVETEEGRRVSGELTRSGRKKVAVSRAPGTLLPGAAGEFVEDVAGLDFELREGARERREEFLLDDPLDAIPQYDLPEVEAEDFLGFATAAAPLAVAEPTPAGEAVVGGALLAGGALVAADAVASGRAERADPAGLSAAVDVPELELPEDPSKPFFKSDKPVGPSSLELPELLPPTTDKGNLRRGRFTPPEIEVTGDVDTFVPEYEVPSEPAGKPVSELEVPTVEAAQLAEPKQVTRQEPQTVRRRERTRVPSDFIPSDPVTIGGGVGEGIGEVGGSGGFGITVRDDPRSTDLERFVTGRGVEVELDAAFTRFAQSEAASIDVADLEEQLLGQGEATSADSLLAGGVDIDAALADVGAAVDADVTQDVDLDLSSPTRTATPTVNLTEPVEAFAVDDPVEVAELDAFATGAATATGGPGARGPPRFDLPDLEDIDPLGEPGEFELFSRTFEFETDLSFFGEASDALEDLDAIDADLSDLDGGGPSFLGGEAGGPSSWHTRRERDLIESWGGTWTNTFGVDGEVAGRPVEVRTARDDDRFRINRATHKDLLEDDGFYIFDREGDGIPPVEVPADELPLPGGVWFSDRGYRHKFVDVDEAIGAGRSGGIGAGLEDFDAVDRDLAGLDF